MKGHEIIRSAVRAELTDKEQIRAAALSRAVSDKPSHRTPVGVIAGVIAAALIFILSFSINNYRSAPAEPAEPIIASETIASENHSASEEAADTESPLSVEKQEFDFVLTVYAAASEGQVLTPEFMTATIPTALQPDTKVLLASYSPLMGSVPGLPFTFATTEGAYDIQASVDNGTLCQWDIQLTTVTQLGNKVLPSKGETLYWSPLQENGGLAENATITLTIYEGDKILGTQDIIITQEDYLFYATIGQ
jgi:hypothetical protein